MQTATLTFTDHPDGTVGINLTFEPALKVSGTVTPAVDLAFEALEALIARTPASDKEQ